MATEELQPERWKCRKAEVVPKSRRTRNSEICPSLLPNPLPWRGRITVSTEEVTGLYPAQHPLLLAKTSIPQSLTDALFLVSALLLTSQRISFTHETYFRSNFPCPHPFQSSLLKHMLLTLHLLTAQVDQGVNMNGRLVQEIFTEHPLPTKNHPEDISL